MLYQKIFSGEEPYHIRIGALSEFPEHRHADFEFNFCVSGSFDITADGVTYRIGEGSAIFVPPMVTHRIPVKNDCTAVTLIVGASLLSKHFNDFLKFELSPQVHDLNRAEDEKIKALFLECCEEKSKNAVESELIIKGNIYKILAYFLRTLCNTGSYTERASNLARIKDIEKAQDLIHFNYREPLTVERVAEQLGYSKSNFCKIFKSYVGEGFHQALNRYRVKCGADLLLTSELSVAQISEEVGFHETKSFCRIFKEIYGTSPGKYRKR